MDVKVGFSVRKQFPVGMSENISYRGRKQDNPARDNRVISRKR